jgi:superfamily II DNA or RNA helicase/HKD family nuclease
MRSGLYESLITSELEAQLEALVGLESRIEPVDVEDEVHVLTAHIAAAVRLRLEELRDRDERLRLANVLLNLIDRGNPVQPPTRELLALSSPRGPGSQSRYDVRPKTPLKDPALLTNAHGEPSLASEINAELDSADSVDLLCAFVMWRGVRLLAPALGRIRKAGVPFRLVTTTYIGGTEREALDRLVRDYGAQVKVQYDAARTRLHAKAWLFRRDTGFDTAYVGSSNLTTTALLDGVEWNVRLASRSTPSLLQKFEATFDSYWNSAEFERYDPDLDRDRLDDALLEASGRRPRDRVTVALSGLDVRPYPYQQEMLDAIDAERAVHGRHRNLVVAATGTGKTVVAALDYRRLSELSAGTQPTLLFVAHRKEILEQSLRTYREVLSDASFGELYVGMARPERWRHVFASVQSLTAYGAENIPADAFDVVVIDEFHHAEAPTYRRLIDHLRPVELLGLTATPERMDGTDVRSFFDGRTATELRLWDALGADLLCPFHYFATADGTDLRAVQWSRGRYDEGQLSNLFTASNARVRIVLKELVDKVADVGAMRAIGFCVSVSHAEYMARSFNDAGIPSSALTGATPAAERAATLDNLRTRKINAVFAVDVLNEGLDAPDVDTILMLRPTESATLFLQQLGRGLRRTPGKAVLTVLDFIGHHRKEFNFAQRFRALTGATRRRLERDIEDGFGFLPSGCQIVLDQQSQAIVLENLRFQVASRWQHLVSELRSLREPGISLEDFVEESGVELSDILRRGSRSWTELRRAAGMPTADGSTWEKPLLKRVRAFAHVDDPQRAEAYRRLMSGNLASAAAASADERRLGEMLYYSLWSDGGGFASYADGLSALRDEPALRSEIAEVVDYAYDSARRITIGLTGKLADIPLRVHARYQREEILAALNFPLKPSTFREGVWYSSEHNVDAFFVTLTKSEADYSPTTMYADYPISPTLFHWESQSTTSITSPTGQRYLSGSSTVLIFCRQHQTDEFGTAAYLFLGPATYVTHQGNRPIAITWKLQHPIPTDFFHTATAAAQ